MTTAQPTITESRATFGGTATRTLRTTGGRGPTIVLLHGFGDSADTWRPVLAHLHENGRRAIAVDLPGFGHAKGLRREPLLPQWDAFLTAMITSITKRSKGGVVLCGNSLGGLLALRMPQRTTLDIAAVVALAPGGFDRPGWLRVLRDDLLLRRLLAIPVPIPRKLIEITISQLYLRAAFHRPARIDPRVVADFSGHTPDKRSIRRLLAVGRALARETTAGDLRMDQVRCPVLVVWGKDDRMLSPAGADVIADVVPDAQILLLDHCGHCPQVEHPASVAAAIDDVVCGQRSAAARRRTASKASGTSNIG